MIQGIKNLEIIYFGVDETSNSKNDHTFVMAASPFKSDTVRVAHQPSMKHPVPLYDFYRQGSRTFVYTKTNGKHRRIYTPRDLYAHVIPQLVRGFFSINKDISLPDRMKIFIDGAFNRRQRDLTRNLTARGLRISGERVSCKACPKRRVNYTSPLIAFADGIASAIPPTKGKRVFWQNFGGLRSKQVPIPD